MTELVRYDAACKAIAEAKHVDEVRDIRDKSIAMKAYAKVSKNHAMEADAAEIRQRATRRIGELIEEQKQTVGLAKPGRRPKNGLSKNPIVPTLADAGIDKNLANEARQLADLDEDAFEDVVVKTRKAVNKASRTVVANKTKKQRRDARELAVAKSLPDGVYGIAVEDFEWDQEPYSDEGRAKHASNTYETATDAHTPEEIVARTEERFRCVAKDHALLFMFVTMPHLAIGIDVMRLREFRYVSHHVWHKQNHFGTGYWFREVHETLLVGVRGNKIPAPLQGTQLDSMVSAPKPNAMHSSKPDYFFKWLVKMYPNVPKIELNARGPREGFDVWGYES